MYFVQMDNDGGKSKYSKYSDMAGAKYGTGYCDAQCPHDMKWTHGRANVEGWVPSATDEIAGKGKYGTCGGSCGTQEGRTVDTLGYANDAFYFTTTNQFCCSRVFFISVRQVVVSMWSVVMCVRISMNLQNVYLLQ